ncbi:UvrD-helicase domain-containing protein [Flavobacterium selenitireducens]|uniref:UvrD-helicase domain-containing protein n=1 Tax=Flavobacterium selenitireducens TaxID=2722704 RepID=UPI00168A9B57|nr:UvrD-helicase domain-containing protein [Flavobacterium selenitireducens]MBD3582254.1 UvrD-helicase domain-containing protein [Flavobacterium selenitireducens]
MALLFVTGFWWLRGYRERERKRKELKEKIAKEKEETRQRLFAFYKSKLPEIALASKVFSDYLQVNAGYFTNYRLSVWKQKNNRLFDEISENDFESVGLPADDVKTIGDFRNYVTNGEKVRSDFNKRFLAQEIENYGTFFDSVEGRKLDMQQRTAVVTDEDNNIVIAGAGSGKTTTIVAKVNYVLHRYDVKPEEILLISFTRKSAGDLVKRIGIPGIEAKTFHKFGKDIITQFENKKPSIFDSNQFGPVLTRSFNQLCGNREYMAKVTDYFADFLKPYKSQFDFEDRGAYIQYIKDQNFRSYKTIALQRGDKVTYKMEVVKSIEECKIANFLLFNNIEYDYEYPYEHDTATLEYGQYKPDFTIKHNGRKIYLEHYGVLRTGDVPPFFAKEDETYEDAKQRYWQKIDWARQMHAEKETTLVETFSYEMQEDILFDNLTKNLAKLGIIAQPKSHEEIWRIIGEAAKEEVKAFIELFSTFIALMKSNNFTVRDLADKTNAIKDDFIRKRNTAFLELLSPIYESYERNLAERREIDFSDMINKASGLVASGDYSRKLKYVIIDEFQDISIGRYKLVKAIKEANPDCKLFSVGDDWQSIYRFTGSDIALFKDFENYFGHTAKSKIETTYRFHNPLMTLSSDFILRNPNQTKKTLRSRSNDKCTNYNIHYSESEDLDDTYNIKQILDNLVATDPAITTKEILILGRYSFDIRRIKNEDNTFSIDPNTDDIIYITNTPEGNRIKIAAKFMTVHKSKGLEAEIVIILNCNAGRFGFPAEMSDDPVLNMLLSEADQFENGEERRLFYVAMTRAREQVYFVTDAHNKSKFIAELEVKTGQSTKKKCPACKTADLVVRKTGRAKNGNLYEFVGCSNYSYGCDYNKTNWTNFNGKKL